MDSRGRGFQAFHGSEGSFETRLDPCIEAMPMDNPALSLLLVQHSRHRGNAKFPVALALAKARVHVHIDDCPTRGRDRERERASVHSRRLYLSLSLSFNIGQGFYRLSRMEFL